MRESGEGVGGAASATQHDSDPCKGERECWMDVFQAAGQSEEGSGRPKGTSGEGAPVRGVQCLPETG